MRAAEGVLSIYEVILHVLGEHLAAHPVHYGQIQNATPDSLNGGSSFEIFLDCKAFISLPKCLDVDDQQIPVIVTGHARTCWMLGKAYNISYTDSQKKAFGVLSPAGPNLPPVESVISVSPVVDMPTNGTGVVKTPVRSNVQPHFPKIICQLRMSKRRNG